MIGLAAFRSGQSFYNLTIATEGILELFSGDGLWGFADYAPHCAVQPRHISFAVFDMVWGVGYADMQ